MFKFFVKTKKTKKTKNMKKTILILVAISSFSATSHASQGSDYPSLSRLLKATLLGTQLLGSSSAIKDQAKLEIQPVLSNNLIQQIQGRVWDLKACPTTQSILKKNIERKNETDSSVYNFHDLDDEINSCIEKKELCEKEAKEITKIMTTYQTDMRPMNWEEKTAEYLYSGFQKIFAEMKKLVEYLNPKKSHLIQRQRMQSELISFIQSTQDQIYSILQDPKMGHCAQAKLINDQLELVSKYIQQSKNDFLHSAQQEDLENEEVFSKCLNKLFDCQKAMDEIFKISKTHMEKKLNTRQNNETWGNETYKREPNNENGYFPIASIDTHDKPYSKNLVNTEYSYEKTHSDFYDCHIDIAESDEKSIDINDKSSTKKPLVKEYSCEETHSDFYDCHIEKESSQKKLRRLEHQD